MSPVFRHGRLRLYLLKLLDESPRHGYEVIRLLQDRFMGIYAPSPGTIYPRLARLEEDGLVTHEEIDGKKVYSITDKGREEIRNRLSDLADLEDELTESLRDVAREISEDVRETVRTIREELASAAREFRADSGRAGGRTGGDAGVRDRSDDSTAQNAGTETAGDDRAAESESQRIRSEARRRRDQMRASFRAQGRGHSDWAAWQGWGGRSEGSPWSSWADWISESGSAFGSGEGRAGRKGFASGGQAGQGGQAGHAGQAGQAAPGAPDSSGSGTSGSGTSGSGRSGSGGSRSRRSGPNPFSDLERMAMQFATELRSAARQAGDIGERSLSDLRDILTDTLAKVRVEVFSDTGPGSTESGSTESGSTESGSTGTGPSGEASTEADAADEP